MGVSVSFMRVGRAVGLEKGRNDGHPVDGNPVGLEEGTVDGHPVEGLEVGFVDG